MSNKIYIGDGKFFTTQYGQAFESEFNIGELEAVIAQAKAQGLTRPFSKKNGRTDEVMKIVFWEKRDQEKYHSHRGTLSDANYYKEKATGDNVANSVTASTATQATANQVDDDLPF